MAPAPPATHRPAAVLPLLTSLQRTFWQLNTGGSFWKSLCCVFSKHLLWREIALRPHYKNKILKINTYRYCSCACPTLSHLHSTSPTHFASYDNLCYALNTSQWTVLQKVPKFAKLRFHTREAILGDLCQRQCLNCESRGLCEFITCLLNSISD